MNVGIAQGDQNPNSTWLNSRGVWLTYIILIFVLHLILLSIPYISTPVAWTLTTTIHNLVGSMSEENFRENINSFTDFLVDLLSISSHQRSTMGDR